jgi:hypothetical protein
LKECNIDIPMKMPRYIMDPINPNSMLLRASLDLICTDAAAKLP